MRSLHSFLGAIFPVSILAYKSPLRTYLPKRALHRALLLPFTLSCYCLTASTLFSAMNSPVAASVSSSADYQEYDVEYPGTAVLRMRAARERVRNLTHAQLNGDWSEVRRNILWAGGLRDLTNVPPGKGYTGHSFNDYNHCDLTAMIDSATFNENDGKVPGIAFSNQLGPGIRIASLPELGPGGSWSTCMIGSNREPPRDVAHVQFRSRVAFKLVWAPPDFNTFVLVDDAGALLARGSPTGALPHIAERSENYRIVYGSKYAVEADKIAREKYRSL